MESWDGFSRPIRLIAADHRRIAGRPKMQSLGLQPDGLPEEPFFRVNDCNDDVATTADSRMQSMRMVRTPPEIRR
jgi:hypothetical protein